MNISSSGKTREVYAHLLGVFDKTIAYLYGDPSYKLQNEAVYLHLSDDKKWKVIKIDDDMNFNDYTQQWLLNILIKHIYFKI